MSANIGNIFGSLRMRNDALKRDLRQSQLAVRTFTMTSAAQMKTVGASVVGVTKKLMNMRTLLLGGGAFLLFRSAIREASEFQNELGKVASLVDDTTIVFGKFKGEIKDLAMEFGQSKTSLTKGLFDIISATISTEDAMEVLTASTKLAVGGFTETGVATSAIITAFQTFREQLTGAADASDLLFTIQKRGRLTVADVANTFGTIAASAKAANLTVEDLGASFSAISRSGVGAQRTVVQLLRLIDSFTDADDDAVKVAKKFGVEMNNSAIAGGNLIKTILKLKDATNEETSALFPEIRARKGFNALVAQSSELMNDLAEMTDRGGNTQRALNKAMTLSDIAFKRHREAVKLLMEAFGEGLLPAITKSVDKTTEFIKFLEDTGKLHAFSLEVGELARQFGWLAAQIGNAFAALKLIATHTPSSLLNQLGMAAVGGGGGAGKGIRTGVISPTLAGFDPRGVAGGIDTKDVESLAKAVEYTTEKFEDMDWEINRKGIDLKKMGGMGKDVFDAMTTAVTGWGSSFSRTLTDILFGAELTFGSVLESFTKMLTQMILQITVIEPLIKGVFGLFGGGGILGGLFGGGSNLNFGGGVSLPSVASLGGGQNMVGMLSPLDIPVMDKGGIIPGARGAPTPFIGHGGEEVIPVGGRSSGGGIVVNQTINVSPGLPETVRIEMAKSIPKIKQAATDAVLQGRRRGGSLAQAMGSKA